MLLKILLKTWHLNDFYEENNLQKVFNYIDVDQNVQTENNDDYAEFANVRNKYEKMHEWEITPFINELIWILRKLTGEVNFLLVYQNMIFFFFYVKIRMETQKIQLTPELPISL